jgi:hypothetical protein
MIALECLSNRSRTLKADVVAAKAVERNLEQMNECIAGTYRKQT